VSAASSNVTVPPVGGSRPMRVRIVVVLPMPFRPISVTTSPAPTAKLTSNSTCAGPYPACRCSMASKSDDGRWTTDDRCPFPSSVLCPPSSVIRSPHLVAEIGRRYLRIGAHLLRRAAREHATIDEHRDAVGERKHRRHVVLDQHHGKAALEPAQQTDEARG